ncbi:MAG: hypothetical protein K2X81_09650, partial [Candidatus Obscuribacterales bacterium]|nr:hypothetical protein [Candidatus Obscuribacterales bacterium]
VPGIREFVASEDISGLLPALRARGLSDPALVKVREVLGVAGDKSQLGPERTMLIGHAEPGMKLPVEKAAAADLLATCDPKLLEALGLRDVGSKHIFPDAGSSKVLLQVPGSNRLRFSLPDALANSPHANEPLLELGNKKQDWVENPRDPLFPGLYPVSDLLRGLEKSDNFYNNHDVRAMIKAMENYPTRASKILGGGSDTVAIQLENGNVLRLTDKDFESPQGKYAWDEDWGTRWVHWKDKYVRIDSRILTPPKHTLIGETNVISYEQQKGISPVSVDHTKMFDAMIEKDGHYIFWDKDPTRLKSHGADQLAYVPLVRFKNGDLSGLPVYDPISGRMTNKAVALIDYDAVRIEGEQPYQPTGANEEWIGGRYLRQQYLDE